MAKYKAWVHIDLGVKLQALSPVMFLLRLFDQDSHTGCIFTVFALSSRKCVQYREGFSTVGDILSTLGNILSTVGGGGGSVQYYWRISQLMLGH